MAKKNKKEKKKMTLKKKLIIAGSIIGGILVIGIAAYIPLSQNIRYRMLRSIMNMSNHTLSNQAYLFNDIDIQELCRDYMNGDVEVEGTVGLSKIEDLRLSINVSINGVRSFEQKRMACSTTVKALRYEVGTIDLYAEKEELYFSAPFLGDMSYAFNLGKDMFPKAPDMGSDIDRQWFKENRKNIFDFIREIGIEDLHKTLEDGSKGYRVTIPCGSGAFLWELMGMEAPTKDVVYDMYLTKKNTIRRIEMDLSDSFDGGYVIVDGEDLGNVTFSCNLPDNESMKIVASRNQEYTHRIDIDMFYNTKDQKIYEITTAFEWMYFEDQSGFECKAKNVKILCDDKQLASGSFKGNIYKKENLSDVFEGKEDYLYSLEERTWQQIRGDVESFTAEMLDKLNIFK